MVSIFLTTKALILDTCRKLVETFHIASVYFSWCSLQRLSNQYSCFDHWLITFSVASHDSSTDSDLQLLTETEQDQMRHSFNTIHTQLRLLDLFWLILADLICNDECVGRYDPVCTSNSRTFGNRCFLNVFQCHNYWAATDLKVVSMGTCPKGYLLKKILDYKTLYFVVQVSILLTFYNYLFGRKSKKLDRFYNKETLPLLLMWSIWESILINCFRSFFTFLIVLNSLVIF